MFGMGGSEILVILVVALLFLGPEKLPHAAKQISKGIRDIKKQSRSLQQQIENDERIGGAIRDIKSALRGEEAPPPRPKTIKPKKPKALVEGAGEAAALAVIAGGTDVPAAIAAAAVGDAAAQGEAAVATGDAPGSASPAALATADTATVADGPADAAAAEPALTLPLMAGEADPDVPVNADGDEDLRKLIRPAAGTVAKGSEPKHG